MDEDKIINFDLQLFAPEDGAGSDNENKDPVNKTEDENKQSTEVTFTPEQMKAVQKMIADESTKKINDFKEHQKNENEKEKLKNKNDYKSLWEKEKEEKDKKIQELEQFRINTSITKTLQIKNIPDAFSKYINVASESEIENEVTELFNLLEVYANNKLDSASKMKIPLKTSNNNDNSKESIGKILGKADQSNEVNEKIINKYFKGGNN